MRGGEYQDFPSKSFCPLALKISVRDSFTVALIPDVEKVWIRGGWGSTKICRRNFSVSQCRKFSLVNHSVLCFRIFPVPEKFLAERWEGESRFSVDKFLSQIGEKFRR